MKIETEDFLSLLHENATSYCVRDPKNDGLSVFSVDIRQLMALNAAHAVVAVVSPKKLELRYFRLKVSEHRARQIIGLSNGSKNRQLPVAEDNRTAVRDGRGYKHHPARCSAYNEQAPAVCEFSV